MYTSAVIDLYELKCLLAVQSLCSCFIAFELFFFMYFCYKHVLLLYVE